MNTENIDLKNSGPKRNRKGCFFIALTAAILFCLFLFGIIPRMIQTNKINAIANEEKLPRVDLITVQASLKPIEIILPSSAQAIHVTPLWARINGYLNRFLVDIGDLVKKGDLLAEISAPELDEQLAQAKAELLNARAARDIAKVTADRWNAIWGQGNAAVTKQQVDQYNANLQSAEAVVLANTKNVSRLTYQQQYKLIYAPFDGYITRRNVDIGTLIKGDVNGATALFDIGEIQTIRFFIQVPQTYFTKIEDNIDAEVTVLELPGQIFKGKIIRYAKALDPQSRTMQTQVDIENPNNILYPGLFGRVKFTVQPDSTSFTIPTQAVIIRSSFPMVAVVDESNTVHLVRVQIGRDYGNQMEITSGLKENDRIVKIPNDRIREGAKVSINSAVAGQTGPTGTVVK